MKEDIIRIARMHVQHADFGDDIKTEVKKGNLYIKQFLVLTVFVAPQTLVTTYKVDASRCRKTGIPDLFESLSVAVEDFKLAWV